MAELAPSHDGRAVLRWVWSGYLRRHLPILLFAFLLMAVEGGMLGALSYIIKPMFDRVLVGREISALYWVSFGVFGIFVIRAITGFTHRVVMGWVGQRIAADLQGDIVKHMLSLDMAWFQKTSPGNLIARVQGDSSAASSIWSTVLAAGGRDLVAAVTLSAVAVSIDWRWALIAVAGLPLLLLPILALQRWVRRSARRARGIFAELATRLDEIFHGIGAIKLNRLESRESARFTERMAQFVTAQINTIRGQAGIPALIDIIAGIGMLGVVYFGGRDVISGTKTVGEFMSFFTAMALVFDPLRRLGQVTGAWQVALASLERLYDVFLAHPTIRNPDRPAPLAVPPAKADVKLSDVTLTYGDAMVLNGLTLTAKAGQVTALVGPSGAGKSTVFNLLTRLVEPDAGSVTLGDVPVSVLALSELRGMFSVVSQDALLFDDSLRDNILLGRTDVTEDQLAQVLKAAHVTDFLAGMPDGLASPAGTRGSNLSGGQRQRIAIARALMRDAPILLLDEATSALDTRSEKVVQDALDQLSAGRTTLVIAHRLSTVREAHMIHVMDQGRVVESGTHDELLAMGGVYSGLYRLQFAADK